jgi:hypothetical protein
MGPIKMDIKTVYAWVPTKYFCNDDLNKAKINLEKSNSTFMNKKDIFILSFLGG